MLGSVRLEILLFVDSGFGDRYLRSCLMLGSLRFENFFYFFVLEAQFLR